MSKLIIIAAVSAVLSSLAVDRKVPRDIKKPVVEEKKLVEKERPDRPFPKHWGRPPAIQTRDMVRLPGKFGKGSSTLAHWIKDNLKKDIKPVRKPVPNRPEPAAEVREKIAVVRSKQKELDVVKRELHDKLKNTAELSKSDRLELIKLFKQENADKHQAIKDAQKELQKQIREQKQDGDRRK